MTPPRRLALLLLAVGACAAPSAPPPHRTGKEVRQLRHKVRRLERQRRQLEQERDKLRDELERQRTIVQVARSLERIRGLPIRRPLKVAFVDADWARAHMEQEMEREAPAGYVEAYVATMARLGLLPPGYRLREELLALMGEQVAGFYDTRTRALYVRRDMPAGELILSHEIGHALQDQTFPLRKLQGERKDQDDRAFAVRALVEGDATVAMVAHLRRTITLWKAFRMLPDLLEAMALDDSRLKQAPAYIRESMVQPYLRGMALVQVLRKRGGWRRVDRAFRDPPVSSEQVLHPEKYLLGERPEAVALPDLLARLGPGARVLHENTIGEFGAGVLLGQTTGRAAASRAAAGWGGDRLRCYRRADGRLLLLWLTRWDSLRDAREFIETLVAHLDVRYQRAVRGRPLWQVAAGDVAMVRRHGRGVLLVDGAADRAEARAVVQACGLSPAAGGRRPSRPR